MYAVVDDWEADRLLPEQPTHIKLIYSLEACIAYAGATYLLVTYPYYGYGTAKRASMKEGHWTPPFIARSIPMKHSPPETAGALRELYRSRTGVKREVDDVLRVCDVLGLGDPHVERLGEITELKTSQRTPNRVGAYRTVRYGCKVRGLDNLRNLADPECLKGHVFLPLTIGSSVLQKSNSPGPSTLLYRGKPLISNLERLFEREHVVSKISTFCAEITEAHLVHRERGVLAMIDVSGFGEARSLARDKMHTFIQSGPEVAALFDRHLSDHFTGIAVPAGISQTRATGDGMICGIPDRHDEHVSLADRVRALLNRYKIFVGAVNEMAARAMPAHETWRGLGSRLALTAGEYNYGKIGGPMAINADFDGELLVRLARGEAALRNHTYESRDAQNKSRHWILVDAAFLDEIGEGPLIEAGFASFGPFERKEKEALISGVLFGVPT